MNTACNRYPDRRNILATVRVLITYLLARRGWTGRTTIDPNHTAAVEGDHYLAATTPAQLDAIEAIIEDGQADMLRKALPPVVLSLDAAATLAASHPDTVARLDLDDAAIALLVGGEPDVFTAACANQLASPYGPAGRPCPARPWVCLLCPLAVFLPRPPPADVRRQHLMALLAPTHPAVAPLPMAARRPRSPRFCHIVLNQLTLWLNWLTSEGITELGQVDQDHCDTYLAAHSYTQSQKPRRLLDPGTRKRIVATVQSIATYGDLYTDDRYHPGFTPWDGRPAFEVVGGKPSHENKIQALSEAHLRPLLAAALYTIDVLGPHLAITLDTIAAATAEPARPWGHDATMICRAGDQQQIAWTLPMQARETRSLATLAHFAAMVVTAAITGMRASERAEIVVGSRLDPVDTPGGGRRFRLASRVIKGKQFGGEPDEWIVLPAVDNAVAFAERLLPNMSLTRPRGTRLFGRNWPTMTYLRFRTWVNGPHGRRLGLEPIPDGPCNPRMLRRTLAQEMARRPGGLLAAKVALKHINVVTTEGYTSRPGGSQAAFLAEVEDAEQQHHRGVTADLFRDYQRGITPSGPGARHLLDTFAHIDAALQGQPHAEATVMDNERRIENLLRHTADTLHIGAANYCWFRDPAQALCLRMAGTPTASKPLAGMCDSGRCPQATHHPCHRPVWQDRASTYQVFLDNPRIPDGEKQRLRPEHARTLTVLHQIPGARA